MKDKQDLKRKKIQKNPFFTFLKASTRTYGAKIKLKEKALVSPKIENIFYIKNNPLFKVL